MTDPAPNPLPAPRRASLLVIFLTVFIDLLGFGMVIPLLPIYAREFTTDEKGWQLGALMAIFSVMQFLFAPLWGRLSDRIGRRPVLLVGLAGSVVFYILFGVATTAKSLTLLFVARIGAGIAGATIPTAQAYIADCTGHESRHKGMALIGMAFGLGFTFGPLFGYLAAPTGHGDPGPWPGYAAAILSAVALALAWFRLPESLHPASRSAAKRPFDPQALRDALAVPSILALLVASFVCIFSFANFETTLSMLIKHDPQSPDTSIFGFDWGETCLTYAFIGLTLAVVQGGVVRRLAGKVSEGKMAIAGTLLQIVGFLAVIWAIQGRDASRLFVATAIIVAGFAFLQPSVNSLISRRTDPAKQGGVLGLAQSVSALARIVGALVGIPLLKLRTDIPYLAASALMAVGALLLFTAIRTGQDHPTIAPHQPDR